MFVSAILNEETTLNWRNVRIALWLLVTALVLFIAIRYGSNVREWLTGKP